MAWFGAVSLLMLALPQWQMLPFWHDQQRWGWLVLSVLSLAFLAQVRWPRLEGFFKHRRVFAGVLFCAIFSVGRAANPQWAMLELCSVLSGLTVALACLRACEQWPLPRVSERIAIGVATMVAIFALPRLLIFFAAPFLPGKVPTDLVDELYRGFANVRFMGQFQTATLPMLAAACVFLGSWRRAMSLALLVAWCWLAIYTQSRGTLLASMVMVGAAFGMGNKSARQLAIFLLAGLVVGWGLDALLHTLPANPFSIAEGKASVRHPAGIASLAGREFIWHSAWGAFLSHPLFGLGPMQFAALGETFGAHPHNVILQLLAEWGLLVSVAVLGWAFLAVRRMLRTMRAHDVSGAEIAPLLSVLGLLAQSLVDGVFVIPYTQCLLALISGWAWAVCRHQASLSAGATLSGSPPASARRSQYAFVTLCTLGVVYAVVFSWLDYSGPYQARLQAALTGPYIWPRYWASGFIP